MPTDERNSSEKQQCKQPRAGRGFAPSGGTTARLQRPNLFPDTTEATASSSAFCRCSGKHPIRRTCQARLQGQNRLQGQGGGDKAHAGQEWPGKGRKLKPPTRVRLLLEAVAWLSSRPLQAFLPRVRLVAAALALAIVLSLAGVFLAVFEWVLPLHRQMRRNWRSLPSVGNRLGVETGSGAARRPAKAAASTRLFTLSAFHESSFRRLGIGLYAFREY